MGFYFMCMSVLAACMYVYHVCALASLEARRGHWNPDIGVAGGCAEYGSLLTTEPFLQPRLKF